MEWGIKADEDKLQCKCFKALDEIYKAVEEHICDTLYEAAILQVIAQDQLLKYEKGCPSQFLGWQLYPNDGHIVHW